MRALLPDPPAQTARTNVSTEQTFTCTCGNIVRIIIENGEIAVTKVKCSRCGIVLMEQ